MTNNRQIILDFIRVIAIVGVLANHLYYPVYSRPDFFGGKAWYLALIIYCLSLVSVPIFISISGYLMIPRQESVRDNWKRILNRLVIPLVFWYSFYLVWRWQYRSAAIDVREVLSNIISGNMHVYYFIVILIGLYALLPVFRLIAKEKHERANKLMLFGSFLAGILFYLAGYIQTGNSATFTLVTWWLPFVGYFWFGYWTVLHPPKQTKLYTISFFIYYLFILLVSYLGLQIHSNGYQLAFRNGIYYWNTYLNPLVIVMSLSFFNLLLSSTRLDKFVQRPLVSRLVLQLSVLSYGVFLVHGFVIDVVDIRFGYAIEFIGTNLIGYSIVRPLLVIILSYTVALIISKIPILRKVIGIK
jgi:surface polysaccharide O-acyltransferase-like enzyme